MMDATCQLVAARLPQQVDVTTFGGWADLPRAVRLQWLGFAGQRLSLVNSSTRPLFEGTTFVFVGTWDDGEAQKNGAQVVNRVQLFWDILWCP